jgi:hypothetical protein
MPLDFICVERDNAFQMFVRSFRIELETSRESYSRFYGICHVVASRARAFSFPPGLESHDIPQPTSALQVLSWMQKRKFSLQALAYALLPHDDYSSGGNIVILTE